VKELVALQCNSADSRVYCTVELIDRFRATKI
jgi:hypothetical protein